MRENPPIMVLSDETTEGVTFRFKGNRWALATLVPGVALLWLVTDLYRSGRSQNGLLAIVGLFGLLLVYSSVYSVTSNQWLTVSNSRNTIKFYRRNLYGLVEWERAPSDFQSIMVGRYFRSSNWQIKLICTDGLELHLGENAFGAFTYERAYNLAAKVSSRTGITIKSADQA